MITVMPKPGSFLSTMASALLSHPQWSEQYVPGGQSQTIFRQRAEERNIVLVGSEAMTQAERELWDP